MKYSPLPLVALLILCVVVPMDARETRVYEHPSLDFRFSAPEGMQPVAHPEDDLAYEVVDPKTGTTSCCGTRPPSRARPTT